MKVLQILLLLCSLFSFSQPIAVIKGKEISMEEFERAFRIYQKEIAHLSPRTALERDREIFMREYVKMRIVEEIAKDIGISISEKEVDERLFRWGRKGSVSPELRGFVRREIAVEKITDMLSRGIRITEGEVRAYYLLNKREFFYPRQVKLLRIVADSRRVALRVRRALRRGESLPTRGVIVGRERWYSLQSLPKKVRARLYPYKVGKVTAPIRFEGRYLILKITDTRRSGVLPFDLVREEVRRKLLRIKREEAFRRWFKDMLETYGVKLYLDRLS